LDVKRKIMALAGVSIMAAVMAVPLAVASGMESPAASEGPRVGDTFVYTVEQGTTSFEVTAVRLPPWKVQDAMGGTVYVAPLRVGAAIGAGPSDIWLQDLWTNEPVSAMSIRPTMASDDSPVQPAESREWSHRVAFAQEDGASHCIHALTRDRPVGACHLSISQLRAEENRGTSEWQSSLPAPTTMVSGDVEWTLKSFSRGSDEYPRIRGHDGELSLSRSGDVPWGMVDEDIPHPFPLSYAFRDATANATSDHYSNWAKEQKSAFPVSATLDVAPRAGGADPAWKLVIQGDTSYLTITGRISQFVTHGNLSLSLGLLLPDDTIEETPGHWDGRDEAPPASVSWPRLDESISKVWNRSFPSTSPPVTAWGFAESCRYRCPSDGPLVTLNFSESGHRALHTSIPTTPYSAASLWMRPSGEAVQVDFTSTEPFEPVLAPQAARFAGAPVPTNTLTAIALGSLAICVLFVRLFWKHAAAIFAFAFDRTKRPESETRQRFRRLIAEEPGIHFGQIVRRMHVSNGTAVHHLETLLRRKQVRAERRAGYRCFFPVGQETTDLAAILALKAGGARRIAEALRHGPRRAAQISEATGLSPSTVSYHLGKMSEAGVVETISGQKRRGVVLTRLGRKLTA
jgi:predicted transcriptional regulator